MATAAERCSTGVPASGRAGAKAAAGPTLHTSARAVVRAILAMRDSQNF